MKRTVLLIDYENIQNFDLSGIPEADMEIKVFVGNSQAKIPLELVQSTQRFGSAVEWIKITGSGNNSLDFHIAFYLGKLSQDSPTPQFVILSKDKGFDPLVNYIRNQKISCRRVDTLASFSSQSKAPKAQTTPVDLVSKVINHLSKIDKNKRPKKREKLHQYIKSLFNPANLPEGEISSIIDTLLSQKKIAEVDNQMTYSF